MRTQNTNFLMALLLTISFVAVSCGKNATQSKDSSSLAANDPGPGGGGNNPPADPIVAGNGANVAGNGALSVPTTDAIVARLQNVGLAGAVNVNTANSNFAKAYAQVKANLPEMTDPTKASGFDNVQLLTYGACSDLTTGNTPLMQSLFNVTKANTIAQNRQALIDAGVKIIDRYVAGLASAPDSPANQPVKDSFGKLLDTLGAVATNTSTIGFMSVCMAANTAGSSMLGF